MPKIMVDIDKAFYDWWNNRWPPHIKEDETIMLIAEAAWREASSRKEAKYVSNR